ncbi:TIGR02996 domain-containing protein, partial [bacterium]|nr:TIGR02996 domain-containing protein [bacterium]
MNEQQFIDEIIANPNDETLRIVFADFLEDTGDPRAELIRLQFQRTELSRFDPARNRLRARELKLLRAYGGFGKTPPTIKATQRNGGFIDGIECTITRFL